MEFTNKQEQSSVIAQQVSAGGSLSGGNQPKPVPRTYQNGKAMKPLMEHKRRDRTNRCLNYMKDPKVNALPSECKNVAKLEKADIPELTVQHKQQLQRKHRLADSKVIGSDRFQAGFILAAKEVGHCLSTTPGFSVSIGTKLMTHLGNCMSKLDALETSPTTTYSLVSKNEPTTAMPLTPASSAHSCHSQTSLRPPPLKCATPVTTENVWRPW